MNLLENKKLEAPSGDDRAIIKFGIGVVVAVFIVFGGWAAMAPLATHAVAVGKVSADMNKKTIQHLEGGVVEEILVKDGDVVKKGDLLIKLSAIQTESMLETMESQYQEKLAEFARLEAQRDGLGSIRFPSTLTSQKARSDQNAIFMATKKRQNEEKELTASRITQSKTQIQGLKSIIESKRSRLASIKEEMSEYRVLYEQRLVDKNRLRELERENDTLRGDIDSSESEILRLKEQIIELQTQQQLRDKEFMDETLARYVDVKTAIADFTARIKANDDVLTRTNIIAPIDGVVVGMSMHTVGGVITPGAKILDIVSQDSNLYVIAQVQTTDIDKVHNGLKANIRFSAFDLRHTHEIEGEVIHLSADSFIDEATRMPYYEAKIKVTPKGMEDMRGYGFNLVSGMPAEVMIITGTRTTLSYLTKPFTDMISRGFNEE